MKNNSIKQLLLAMMMLILCAGCNTVKKVAVQATEEKKYDISYGSDKRNIMDVYLPANRTDKTPFVIMIHGGAWTMAGKEYVRDYQDSLLNHGIAVASINHRYANNEGVHYPQMMDDINQAIGYCMANAKEWKIRNDGFVIAGVSSGAHLALLYAYTSAKKINAIVEFCGPNNLTDTAVLNYSVKVGLIDVIQKMTGKKYIKGQDLNPAYQQSSPINYVKNIPVLIIHGTADPVVNFSQSRQLNEKLGEKKIRHKLVPIAGAGHDLNMKDPATRALVYHEAIDWVLKYGN